MGEATAIRGLWWTEGEEKEPTPGTLSIGPDSIILSVWKPENTSFQEMVRGMARDQSIEVPRVIFGTDADRKPVTLFGCGIGNHSVAGGLRTWDIHALAAVKGLRIDAWSQPLAHAVKIEFEYLNRWYGRKLSTREVTENKKLSLMLGDHMDLEFPLGQGVRFRFVEHISFSDSEDEEKISSQSSVWFQFEDPQSLSEITSRWLPWIRALLGLLIGVTTNDTSVEVFPEDPYQPRKRPFECGVLLMNKGEGRGLRGGPAHDSRRMVAAFELIRNKLGSVLTEWDRVYTELRPVVDLFSSVAFRHVLYDEARFLFLVQALEIYHVRSPRFISTEVPRVQHQRYCEEAKKQLSGDVWKWAKGKLRMNHRSLKTKLMDILEDHSVEGKQLFGDIASAASRIAYTRNYLIHYSDERKAYRLLSDAEISAVGWKLEALLWAVLLREIGLGGAPVNRVIGRATGLEFVTMA